ncbi:MAG: hypothetical protein R3E79_51865 [Caldilineaceae bacterium]
MAGVLEKVTAFVVRAVAGEPQLLLFHHPTAGIQTFFVLTYQGESAERWQVYTDHHWFTLFWAPMIQLPSIIAPQDRWVARWKPLYPQVAWAEG